VVSGGQCGAKGKKGGTRRENRPGKWDQAGRGDTAGGGWPERHYDHAGSKKKGVAKRLGGCFKTLTDVGGWGEQRDGEKKNHKKVIDLVRGEKDCNK